MKPANTLAFRYVKMMQEAEFPDPNAFDETMCRPHLIWMCAVIVREGHGWPEDKTGRWLGFVQGVLAAQGMIKVQEEREFSRPLFHEEYASRGIRNPPTLSRPRGMKKF